MEKQYLMVMDFSEKKVYRYELEGDKYIRERYQHVFLKEMGHDVGQCEYFISEDGKIY